MTTIIVILLLYKIQIVENCIFSHQPSAISHQPSAISHQPSAISHQPSAISHQPSTNKQTHHVSLSPSHVFQDTGLHFQQHRFQWRSP